MDEYTGFWIEVFGEGNAEYRDQAYLGENGPAYLGERGDGCGTGYGYGSGNGFGCGYEDTFGDGTGHTTDPSDHIEG